MNNRPVDKTKKSNIKCEHCKHYVTTQNYKHVSFTYQALTVCELTQKEKYYWNMCKSFEWADRYC